MGAELNTRSVRLSVYAEFGFLLKLIGGLFLVIASNSASACYVPAIRWDIVFAPSDNKTFLDAIAALRLPPQTETLAAFTVVEGNNGRNSLTLFNFQRVWLDENKRRRIPNVGVLTASSRNYNAVPIFRLMIKINRRWTSVVTFPFELGSQLLRVNDPEYTSAPEGGFVKLGIVRLSDAWNYRSQESILFQSGLLRRWPIKIYDTVNPRNPIEKERGDLWDWKEGRYIFVSSENFAAYRARAAFCADFPN